MHLPALSEAPPVLGRHPAERLRRRTASPVLAASALTLGGDFDRGLQVTRKTERGHGC
jgi:hypothetical protein